MESLKISLILTVLNEEKTIDQFLESVHSQSRLPDEIVIVDGGSKDNTVAKIRNFKFERKINVSVFVKKGNRSVGRNFAIKKSSFNIILSSDAGCTLDKNWVKNIITPFINKNVDVVSGYYKPITKNVFERCLAAYTCVMPDKIDKENFLPSSRSVAFRKSAWQKAGGYPENLSTCEDLLFDKKMKDLNLKFVFTPNAVVYWPQRKNLIQAFKQFFSYAVGDGYANYFRPQTPFLFLRYLFAIYLVILSVLIKSFLLYGFVFIAPVFYVIWSMEKNYRYIGNKKGLFFLPLLQITSDLAVIFGTTLGYVKYLAKLNYKLIVKNNFPLLILLAIYVLSMLSVIGTGIPGQAHPFPYAMDEWHQSQSVRNVFRFGTPNLPGSANGSMFHFFLSGILLIPFIILHIVNPFVIKSAVDSLPMQEKLFIVFRLNTLFFGVLALVLMSRIAKILKLNQPLSVLLFFATSAWLALSNLFKYDIALVFWVVFAFYYLIKYSFSPNLKNFLLASFLSALAFSVKVSALPLLPILILAYLFFTPKAKDNLKHLLLGLSIYVFTAIFLGIPDIVFGGKSMFGYLYGNIISVPADSLKIFNLGEPLLTLTFFNKLPVIFGHFFYSLSIISFIYVLIKILKEFTKKNYGVLKTYLFVVLSFFVFALSLAPLGILISANRAIVLLPFMVIFCLITVGDLYTFLRNKSKTKIVITVFFIFVLGLQIFESYTWVYLKLSPLPEQTSSSWVVKNIPKGASIGLENIPLYQGIPDFILNEFYQKQYNPSFKTSYQYQIVNAKTQHFPKYIIISNVNYEAKYLKTSPKNDLVKTIKKQGYKQIKSFPLQLPLYNYFEKNYYTPYVGVFVYPESISIFSK